jgi:multisite-specific tRNA:(cytosine-C5)-methyltransferase/tRNA (cytosine34-C5)-methyltransferase
LAQLPHCRRFLPHRMNTGGFFCALFRKNAELENKRQKNRRAQEEEEAEALACAKDEKDGEDGGSKKDVLRAVTKEYEALSAEDFAVLSRFFGLAETAQGQLLFRKDQPEKVFLTTPQGARLLTARARCAQRVVHLGTIALQRCDDFVAYPAPWKLLQEGANALVPYITRRIVDVSPSAAHALLDGREVTLASLGLNAEQLAGLSADGQVEPGPAIFRVPEHDLCIAAMVHSTVVQVAADNAALGILLSVLAPREIAMPEEEAEEEDEAEEAEGDGAGE